MFTVHNLYYLNPPNKEWINITFDCRYDTFVVVLQHYQILVNYCKIHFHSVDDVDLDNFSVAAADDYYRHDWNNNCLSPLAGFID